MDEKTERSIDSKTKASAIADTKQADFSGSFDAFSGIASAHSLGALRGRETTTTTSNNFGEELDQVDRILMNSPEPASKKSTGSEPRAPESVEIGISSGSGDGTTGSTGSVRQEPSLNSSEDAPLIPKIATENGYEEDTHSTKESVNGSRPQLPHQEEQSVAVEMKEGGSEAGVKVLIPGSIEIANGEDRHGLHESSTVVIESNRSDHKDSSAMQAPSTNTINTMDTAESEEEDAMGFLQVKPTVEGGFGKSSNLLKGGFQSHIQKSIANLAPIQQKDFTEANQNAKEGKKNKNGKTSDGARGSKGDDDGEKDNISAGKKRTPEEEEKRKALIRTLVRTVSFFVIVCLLFFSVIIFQWFLRVDGSVSYNISAFTGVNIELEDCSVSLHSHSSHPFLISQSLYIDYAAGVLDGTSSSISESGGILTLTFTRKNALNPIKLACYVEVYMRASETFPPLQIKTSSVVVMSESPNPLKLTSVTAEAEDMNFFGQFISVSSFLTFNLTKGSVNLQNVDVEMRSRGIALSSNDITSATGGINVITEEGDVIVVPNNTTLATLYWVQPCGYTCLPSGTWADDSQCGPIPVIPETISGNTTNSSESFQPRACLQRACSGSNTNIALIPCSSCDPSQWTQANVPIEIYANASSGTIYVSNNNLTALPSRIDHKFSLDLDENLKKALMSIYSTDFSTDEADYSRDILQIIYLQHSLRDAVWLFGSKSVYAKVDPSILHLLSASLLVPDMDKLSGRLMPGFCPFGPLSLGDRGMISGLLYSTIAPPEGGMIAENTPNDVIKIEEGSEGNYSESSIKLTSDMLLIITISLSVFCAAFAATVFGVLFLKYGRQVIQEFFYSFAVSTTIVSFKNERDNPVEEEEDDKKSNTKEEKYKKLNISAILSSKGTGRFPSPLEIPEIAVYFIRLQNADSLEEFCKTKLVITSVIEKQARKAKATVTKTIKNSIQKLFKSVEKYSEMVPGLGGIVSKHTSALTKSMGSKMAIFKKPAIEMPISTFREEYELFCIENNFREVNLNERMEWLSENYGIEKVVKSGETTVVYTNMKWKSADKIPPFFSFSEKTGSLDAFLNHFVDYSHFDYESIPKQELNEKYTNFCSERGIALEPIRARDLKQKGCEIQYKPLAYFVNCKLKTTNILESSDKAKSAKKTLTVSDILRKAKEQEQSMFYEVVTVCLHILVGIAIPLPIILVVLSFQNELHILSFEPEEEITVDNIVAGPDPFTFDWERRDSLQLITLIVLITAGVFYTCYLIELIFYYFIGDIDLDELKAIKKGSEARYAEIAGASKNLKDSSSGSNQKAGRFSVLEKRVSISNLSKANINGFKEIPNRKTSTVSSTGSKGSEVEKAIRLKTSADIQGIKNPLVAKIAYVWGKLIMLARKGNQKILYFMTFVFIVLLAGYIALVLIWALLGAIVSPYRLLPYAAGAATLIAWVTSSYKKLESLRSKFQAKIVKIITSKFEKILKMGVLGDGSIGKELENAEAKLSGVKREFERQVAVNSLAGGGVLDSIGADFQLISGLTKGEKSAINMLSEKLGMDYHITEALIYVSKKDFENLMPVLTNLAPKLGMDPEIASGLILLASGNSKEATRRAVKALINRMASMRTNGGEKAKMIAMNSMARIEEEEATDPSISATAKGKLIPEIGEVIVAAIEGDITPFAEYVDSLSTNTRKVKRAKIKGVLKSNDRAGKLLGFSPQIIKVAAAASTGDHKKIANALKQLVKEEDCLNMPTSFLEGILALFGGDSSIISREGENSLSSILKVDSLLLHGIVGVLRKDDQMATKLIGPLGDMFGLDHDTLAGLLALTQGTSVNFAKINDICEIKAGKGANGVANILQKELNHLENKLQNLCDHLKIDRRMAAGLCYCVFGEVIIGFPLIAKKLGFIAGENISKAESIMALSCSKNEEMITKSLKHLSKVIHSSLVEIDVFPNEPDSLLSPHELATKIIELRLINISVHHSAKEARKEYDLDLCKEHSERVKGMGELVTLLVNELAKLFYFEYFGTEQKKKTVCALLLPGLYALSEPYTDIEGVAKKKIQPQKAANFKAQSLAAGNISLRENFVNFCTLLLSDKKKPSIIKLFKLSSLASYNDRSVLKKHSKDLSKILHIPVDIFTAFVNLSYHNIEDLGPFLENYINIPNQNIPKWIDLVRSSIDTSQYLKLCMGAIAQRIGLPEEILVGFAFKGDQKHARKLMMLAVKSVASLAKVDERLIVSLAGVASGNTRSLMTFVNDAVAVGEEVKGSSYSLNPDVAKALRLLYPFALGNLGALREETKYRTKDFITGDKIEELGIAVDEHKGKDPMKKNLSLIEAVGCILEVPPPLIEGVVTLMLCSKGEDIRDPKNREAINRIAFAAGINPAYFLAANAVSTDNRELLQESLTTIAINDGKLAREAAKGLIGIAIGDVSQLDHICETLDIEVEAAEGLVAVASGDPVAMRSCIRPLGNLLRVKGDSVEALVGLVSIVNGENNNIKRLCELLNVNQKLVKGLLTSLSSSPGKVTGNVTELGERIGIQIPAYTAALSTFINGDLSLIKDLSLKLGVTPSDIDLASCIFILLKRDHKQFQNRFKQIARDIEMRRVGVGEKLSALIKAAAEGNFKPLVQLVDVPEDYLRVFFSECEVVKPIFKSLDKDNEGNDSEEDDDNNSDMGSEDYNFETGDPDMDTKVSFEEVSESDKISLTRKKLIAAYQLNDASDGEKLIRIIKGIYKFTSYTNQSIGVGLCHSLDTTPEITTLADPVKELVNILKPNLPEVKSQTVTGLACILIGDLEAIQNTKVCENIAKAFGTSAKSLAWLSLALTCRDPQYFDFKGFFQKLKIEYHTGLGLLSLGTHNEKVILDTLPFLTDPLGIDHEACLSLVKIAMGNVTAVDTIAPQLGLSHNLARSLVIACMFPKNNPRTYIGTDGDDHHLPYDTVLGYLTPLCEELGFDGLTGTYIALAASFNRHGLVDLIVNLSKTNSSSKAVTRPIGNCIMGLASNNREWMHRIPGQTLKEVPLEKKAITEFLKRIGLDSLKVLALSGIVAVVMNDTSIDAFPSLNCIKEIFNLQHYQELINVCLAIASKEKATLLKLMPKVVESFGLCCSMQTMEAAMHIIPAVNQLSFESFAEAAIVYFPHLQTAIRAFRSLSARESVDMSLIGPLLQELGFHDPSLVEAISPLLVGDMEKMASSIKYFLDPSGSRDTSDIAKAIIALVTHQIEKEEELGALCSLANQHFGGDVNVDARAAFAIVKVYQGDFSHLHSILSYFPGGNDGLKRGLVDLLLGCHNEENFVLLESLASMFGFDEGLTKALSAIMSPVWDYEALAELAKVFSTDSEVFIGILSMARQDLDGMTLMARKLGGFDAEKIQTIVMLISDTNRRITKANMIGKAQGLKSKATSFIAKKAGLPKNFGPEALFQMFDVDGTGKMTFDEFNEFLKYLNIRLSEAKAMKLFVPANKGGERAIDYTGFEKALTSLKVEVAKSAMQALGLNRGALIKVLITGLSFLLFLFAFIFCGIMSFTEVNGGFSAVINSLMPMGAGAGTSGSKEEASEEESESKIESTVQSALEVFTASPDSQDH
eukprot:Nk52_evm10s123 gene=Nk52_evmTU10s123